MLVAQVPLILDVSAPLLRAVLVFTALGTTGLATLGLCSAAVPLRLEVTADLHWYAWMAGERRRLVLRPGSIVGRRGAWLRFRLPGGQAALVWVRPADQSADWRRLQVLWRWRS